MVWHPFENAGSQWRAIVRVTETAGEAVAPRSLKLIP